MNQSAWNIDVRPTIPRHREGKESVDKVPSQVSLFFFVKLHGLWSPEYISPWFYGSYHQWFFFFVAVERASFEDGSAYISAWFPPSHPLHLPIMCLKETWQNWEGYFPKCVVYDITVSCGDCQSCCFLTCVCTLCSGMINVGNKNPPPISNKWGTNRFEQLFWMYLP